MLFFSEVGCYTSTTRGKFSLGITVQ